MDIAEVTKVRRELAPGPLNELEETDLSRLGRRLGVGSFVRGSYSVMGSETSPRLRIELRLLDARSGKLLLSDGSDGIREEVFTLVDQATTGLREYLDAGDLTPEQRLAIKASLPADPQALELYSKGLARLRQFDALGGRAGRSDGISPVKGVGSLPSGMPVSTVYMGRPKRVHCMRVFSS